MEDFSSQNLCQPQEYREKHAKPEDVGATQDEKSSDDEELSEDDYGSSDEAIAGQPDP